jgi:hypothetical protein
MSGPAERSIPAPGWIFGRAEGVPGSTPTGLDLGHTDASIYRIYATSLESTTSMLLEQAPGPLTAPEWSPDGKLLAFGRFVAAGLGGFRYEVVLQQGPRQQSIIVSRPLAEAPPGPDVVATLSPTWSPDGRYLAVSLPQAPFGVSVLRSDNGRVLKTLDGAYWPSWSPDGSRLAVIQSGQGASLALMDLNFGPLRHLADLGQAFHPPVWSRDGKSALVAIRRIALHAGGLTRSVDLVKVQVDTGATEIVTNIAADALDGGKAIRGVSFSLDRDGDDLYFSPAIAGQPAVISWFRPRTREPVDRFHPLDITSIKVGALAVAPSGKPLALRLGETGSAGPLAVWEPTNRQLTPLTPDDRTGWEWLSFLVATARQFLSKGLPPAIAKGRSVERATILPIPGEFASNSEIGFRLRKLGRVGRALCERLQGAADDSNIDAFLCEARLFFDALSQDYASALRSLESYEARTTEPELRLRLLGVRAQFFLGLGEVERARETVAYLQGIEQRTPTAIETTPAGVVLAPATGPVHGWASLLAQRLDALAKQRDLGAEVEPPPPPSERSIVTPLPPLGVENDLRAPRVRPRRPRPAPVPPPPAPAPRLRRQFRGQ